LLCSQVSTHAARTVPRNLSTSSLSRLPSLASSPAALRTCPDDAPVSSVPRLTSVMVSATRVVPPQRAEFYARSLPLRTVPGKLEAHPPFCSRHLYLSQPRAGRSASAGDYQKYQIRSTIAKIQIIDAMRSEMPTAADPMSLIRPMRGSGASDMRSEIFSMHVFRSSTTRINRITIMRRRRLQASADTINARGTARIRNTSS
jgi:hypothetical protein